MTHRDTDITTHSATRHATLQSLGRQPHGMHAGAAPVQPCQGVSATEGLWCSTSCGLGAAAPCLPVVGWPVRCVAVLQVLEGWMQWSGMGLLQHEGFTRAVVALITDLAARLHADAKVC